MNEDNKNFEEKLGKAIRQLAKETIFVPPAKDDEIVGGIRKRFDRQFLNKKKEKIPAKKIVRVSRWQRWIPLAASILVAASILYFSRPASSRSVADVNGDGKVDVLDAFALANQLKSGASVSADVNGDGVVDEKDVREIAARAVRLEEGDRS
jgi:hypothetical protein